ncbi:hypothetical protein SAMN04488034_11328 [Salinimicrobium catena]|uniref:Uncharacterized protein n=1 Tax=Salinimicrobium catena TaxID=390640 RepID=A0A1H5PGE3_9FLAO|nr:hypothetical protein SAMN04488140_11328 [Salinimicrobium catena]SEF12198.1 hypothetical protein SAMN04488034_11328 [Salinimicrobium catena]
MKYHFQKDFDYSINCLPACKSAQSDKVVSKPEESLIHKITILVS